MHNNTATEYYLNRRPGETQSMYDARRREGRIRSFAQMYDARFVRDVICDVPSVSTIDWSEAIDSLRRASEPNRLRQALRRDILNVLDGLTADDLDADELALRLQEVVYDNVPS